MANITQVELRGFSRTIAELEWLILILVLLYFVVPSNLIADKWGLTFAMLIFAAFIVSFRYSKLLSEETHWKLAIETWAIVFFITWSVYHTGGIESPLLNLYLLVIMFSALTLSKGTSMLIFLLITVVYFYLGQKIYVEDTFSYSEFGSVMVLFCPYLLAGYVTTLLAADVQNARERLAHLSNTDNLTGLKNRRAFENEFSIEVKKAIRYKRSFAVMMLDGDNLKVANDQYGHGVGDKLIISLAQVLQDSLRETDILARYGGDEFIVMLPETNDKTAIVIAERIRGTVENTSFNADGNQVSTTLSIGIACYPADSENSEEIIKLADKALYESKHKGKNTITRQTPGSLAY
ncbi:MAG: GGDEF domain-containing protein [Gammaproteobacteria bacterium]|nr:GGDEF domain-containing protein [Gammaproteobacteria bacterium]